MKCIYIGLLRYPSGAFEKARKLCRPDRPLNEYISHMRLLRGTGLIRIQKVTTPNRTAIMILYLPQQRLIRPTQKSSPVARKGHGPFRYHGVICWPKIECDFCPYVTREHALEKIMFDSVTKK